MFILDATLWRLLGPPSLKRFRKGNSMGKAPSSMATPMQANVCTWDGHKNLMRVMADSKQDSVERIRFSGCDNYNVHYSKWVLQLNSVKQKH